MTLQARCCAESSAIKCLQALPGALSAKVKQGLALIQPKSDGPPGKLHISSARSALETRVANARESGGLKNRRGHSAQKWRTNSLRSTWSISPFSPPMSVTTPSTMWRVLRNSIRSAPKRRPALLAASSSRPVSHMSPGRRPFRIRPIHL